MGRTRPRQPVREQGVVSLAPLKGLWDTQAIAWGPWAGSQEGYPRASESSPFIWPRDPDLSPPSPVAGSG